MNWSVVQTESQRELVADDYLKRGGFETYLPRIRIRSHARTRNVALFPSYLFVQIGTRWYDARWTIGVIRILQTIVGEGDQLTTVPALVPDEYIEFWRKREGPDGFVKLPRAPTNRLKKGQRVRIVRGSFEGRLAVYEGMSGRERERVLLELLGQFVPVDLPARDIVAATV